MPHIDDNKVTLLPHLGCERTSDGHVLVCAERASGARVVADFSPDSRQCLLELLLGGHSHVTVSGTYACRTEGGLTVLTGVDVRCREVRRKGTVATCDHMNLWLYDPPGPGERVRVSGELCAYERRDGSFDVSCEGCRLVGTGHGRGRRVSRRRPKRENVAARVPDMSDDQLIETFLGADARSVARACAPEDLARAQEVSSAELLRRKAKDGLHPATLPVRCVRDALDALSMRMPDMRGTTAFVYAWALSHAEDATFGERVCHGLDREALWRDCGLAPAAANAGIADLLSFGLITRPQGDLLAPEHDYAVWFGLDEAGVMEGTRELSRHLTRWEGEGLEGLWASDLDCWMGVHTLADGSVRTTLLKADGWSRASARRTRDELVRILRHDCDDAAFWGARDAVVDEMWERYLTWACDLDAHLRAPLPVPEGMRWGAWPANPSEAVLRACGHEVESWVADALADAVSHVRHEGGLAHVDGCDPALVRAGLVTRTDEGCLLGTPDIISSIDKERGAMTEQDNDRAIWLVCIDGIPRNWAATEDEAGRLREDMLDVWGRMGGEDGHVFEVRELVRWGVA